MTKRHAIRNGYTLCGFPVRSVEWVDEDSSYHRCPTCAAVPTGHLTHHDFTTLGITYRQLDHWTRRGYLQPVNPDCGSGRLRTYPPAELTAARIMARLTAAGIEPEAASRAARNYGELAPGVVVTLD